MRLFFVRSFYSKVAIFILLSIALLETLLLVFDSSPPEQDLLSPTLEGSTSSHPDGSSFFGFFSMGRAPSRKEERDLVDMKFLLNHFDRTVKKDGKQASRGPPRESKVPPKDSVKEQQEKEKAKKEEEQRERLEQQRLQREEAEKERSKKEGLEKERLEKERLEKERVEKERVEKERGEKERVEKERMDKEEQERKAKQQQIGFPSFSIDPFKGPQSLQPSDGNTKPTNILDKSTSPGDSIGFRFLDDPRSYLLCHFKNVCVNSTSYMIIVNNEEERKNYISQLEYCGERSQRRMNLCACFTKQLSPVFVAASSVSKFPKKKGHWWVSDKWVFGHQISHWAEKLVNMHSVMQKWDSYSLPSIGGIAFLKDSLPMTDHEQAIFEISTSTFPQKVQTMWLSDFETGGWCFEQTSMSSLTSTIATSPVDANKFRENAYKYFDLEKEDCPPPKAMLLYRSEPLNRRRMILNLDEVDSLMRRYGIKTFDKITVGSETTSQEQANLFSQYGLILSSHSSQLVNTLFSQPNSTVIEIVPAFFNYDFGEMANQMGLRYLISLGGEAPNLSFPKDASECQESFAECHGEGTCFGKLQKTLRQSCIQNGTPYKDYSIAIKHLDFKADIAILEESLKKALDHLHQSCGGHWRGTGISP